MMWLVRNSLARRLWNTFWSGSAGRLGHPLRSAGRLGHTLRTAGRLRNTKLNCRSGKCLCPERTAGASQNLFNNAATQKRKCPLRYYLTHRLRDRRRDSGLSFRLAAGNCFGVLQNVREQLPFLGAENSLILHQRFRKSIEDLLRRHQTHSSVYLVDRLTIWAKGEAAFAETLALWRKIIKQILVRTEAHGGDH